MDKQAKIYIAGHTGLVGGAITRALRADGYANIVTRPSGELDLTRQDATRAFFEEERPEFVFLAAAKVGGIQANNTYPAEFYYDNVMIQTHVIDAAYRVGVQRLLFLGSSCIYPRLCPQPMAEAHLLCDYLEPTNRPYALAKIGGIEQCWAYNRQYGTRFLAAMPTNLYGPGDNYDLQNSHVLPAMIRKMHEAKLAARADLTLWGTGKPTRELLFNEDLARAVIFLMTLDQERFDGLVGNQEQAPLINVGYGSDQTIASLAERVADVVGFSGRIQWDPSKPDGTPKKLLDSSRMFSLGWRPSVSLDEGIRRAYADYLGRLATV